MEQPNIYNTLPQPPAGDHLALSAQRPRGRTACSACSKRKVKCDAYERVPCTNCAKRGPGSQLCTFNDDAPRSGTKRSRVSEGDASPATPRMKKDSKRPAQPVSFLDGIHTASASYSQPPPAGWPHANAPNGMAPPNTCPPQKSYNVIPGYPPPYPQYQTAPPQLYPRPPPAGPVGELTDLLPSHRTLLRYFDIYKALCHPIYPVITDLEDFENAVCRYMEDFNSGRFMFDFSALSGRTLTGRLSWFALLTAAVATGVQYSDMPTAERDPLCARYLRNATEILRMADYMGRPDENCVAAMLLICRTMENELMPEAAWTSLGLIGRMSELAGLQAGTSFNSELDVKTREVIHLRHRKLWWSYLWEESALALCFGKAASLKDSQDEPPISTTANLTYNDCMLLLCKLAIRARPDESVERSNLKAEIEALASARHLHEQALPRLSDRQNCRTIQDRIEYYSLRISQGFIVSCMSQTLMKASLRQGWDSQRRALQSMCKEGALDCLQAFVDMQSFSIVPLRTWMFIFSALSSALVLTAVIDEGDRSKVQELQMKLLSSLAERDAENELPNRPGWFARYPKALQLLRQVTEGTGTGTGKAEEAATNGRKSSEAESKASERVPEQLSKDLLDPLALWEGLFSERVAGVGYPTQQIVVGT